MNVAIAVDSEPADDPEANLAENEALTALNECSGAEAAAMSAWAQAGCAGDPPQPQTEARRKLTARLASASAHAAAARAAIGDVEAQQRELAARLAAVSSRMEIRVGEILVRECPCEIAAN